MSSNFSRLRNGKVCRVHSHPCALLQLTGFTCSIAARPSVRRVHNARLNSANRIAEFSYPLSLQTLELDRCVGFTSRSTDRGDSYDLILSKCAGFISLLHRHSQGAEGAHKSVGFTLHCSRKRAKATGFTRLLLLSLPRISREAT